MAELSIASDFPAATRDQWMKLVEGVLKGAPFERKLVSTTYDGIAIQPLYPKAEGRAPIAGRMPGTPWAVMARVDHPDAATANAMALEDLQQFPEGRRGIRWGVGDCAQHLGCPLCCSSASSCSRVSTATLVSVAAAGVLRRRTAFGAFRRFGVTVLRRCAPLIPAGCRIACWRWSCQ